MDNCNTAIDEDNLIYCPAWGVYMRKIVTIKEDEDHGLDVYLGPEDHEVCVKETK